MSQANTEIFAQEVASILVVSCDNPGMLDRYFAIRAVCDDALWREVITVLARMRG